MRVGVYVRVSTREQASEGYSIKAQLNRLKAFCDSQDWNMVATYVDEGKSAKDLDRPQLQQMISDIKDDNIDVVLVYRLDRLTRSVFNLYELLKIFEEYDCGFKSATEVYDTTTAMGRLFITIVAALAQWERENLGERVSMGMDEKASQGLFPRGNPPYGFDLENSILKPNGLEVDVVNLIYRKYVEGYGMHRVALYLNNKDIRTREGGFWYRSGIQVILKSEFVRGNIFWNGKVYKGLHERIVDEETCLKVDKIIKRRKNSTSSVSSDYIFSSVVKCCFCGSNLHGNSTTSKGKSYYMYRCSKRGNGECKGLNTNVSELQLERQFLSMLKQVDLTKEVDNVDINKVEDQEEKKNNLDKELKSIQARRKKWQFAWMEDLITSKDLKQRMKEEEIKERQVINALNELDEVTEEYDIEEVKELLSDIEINWNVLTRTEKKQLVQTLVERIDYEKNGTTVNLTNIELVV